MKYGLSDSVIEKICGVFARYPQVEKVLLYGSRARGNYKSASDIDMTICHAGNTDKFLLSKIHFELDDLLLPYMIDLSLLEDIDDPGLLEHIRRVGAPLYVKAA
ncbi:MAG: nucleotidyltransferase domain-containing protein [Gammaproteobacteria bacterium]